MPENCVIRLKKGVNCIINPKTGEVIRVYNNSFKPLFLAINAKTRRAFDLKEKADKEVAIKLKKVLDNV